MVQTTKPVYKSSSFEKKPSQTSYTKPSFDFKDMQKATPKMNIPAKTADPWGKTFKNETHFKSLHLC